MKRKTLVLLVCLVGWVAAKSQVASGSSIVVEDDKEKKVVLKFNNRDSVILNSLANIDSLDIWLDILLADLHELETKLGIDTPRQDTSKTVEVKSVKTDSGVVMAVTVKDETGINTELYDLSDKEERKKFKKRMREVFREDNEDDHEYDFHSFNQDDDDENDRVTEDWLNLDIGFNSLLYNGSPSFPSSLSNLELDPLKSLHVNVDIFQQKVRLYKKNVSLFYGINYDNNDYRFSRNIDFRVNNDNKLSYERDSVTPGFVRNKLTTRFVTIPLGFNFVINPSAKRSFHIAVGMHAGYRLTSFFKKVYNDEGKRKRKIHDDYELNNFRYGAFVKVGYGSFTLFGNYVMTPLFREGAGPEFNTFSFGLTIGDFLSN